MDIQEIETLEKAISTANDLVVFLKKSLDIPQLAAKKAAIAEQQAEEITLQGRQKLKELLARQEEVRLREDDLRQREALLARYTDIAASERKLEHDRNDFEAVKRTFTADMKKQRAALEQLAADIHSAQADVRHAKELLEGEKRTFRAKVLQEIGKEAGL